MLFPEWENSQMLKVTWEKTIIHCYLNEAAMKINEIAMQIHDITMEIDELALKVNEIAIQIDERAMAINAKQWKSVK